MRIFDGMLREVKLYVPNPDSILLQQWRWSAVVMSCVEMVMTRETSRSDGGSRNGDT